MKRSLEQLVRIARLAPKNRRFRRATLAAIAGRRAYLDALEHELTIPLAGRRFPSHRASKCAACGAAIEEGEPIAWIVRAAVCLRCAGPERTS